MMTSNNALVPDADKEDTIASKPFDWPWLYNGMRMNGWQDNGIKYYLVGNAVVWWMASASLGIWAVTLLWHLMRFQRKINDFAPGASSRLSLSISLSSAVSLTRAFPPYRRVEPLPLPLENRFRRMGFSLPFVFPSLLLLGFHRTHSPHYFTWQFPSSSWVASPTSTTMCAFLPSSLPTVLRPLIQLHFSHTAPHPLVLCPPRRYPPRPLHLQIPPFPPPHQSDRLWPCRGLDRRDVLALPPCGVGD